MYLHSEVINTFIGSVLVVSINNNENKIMSDEMAYLLGKSASMQNEKRVAFNVEQGLTFAHFMAEFYS